MNPSSSPKCEQSESSADATLLDQYLRVRRHTETLVAPLNAEDMAVQSMPDASPVKWHLAHTTWFFETFLLSASTSIEVLRPGRSIPGKRKVMFGVGSK